MSNQTVSVISVIYNIFENDRVVCFKQMIESVQDQVYDNIQHLIIDGDSNDGTQEFVRDLVSNYNNVTIISEPDNGIYNAFNKGIKLARGEYILFLNSDDYLWDKVSVKLLIDKLCKDGTDFVCASAMILSDGKQSVFSPNMNSYLSKTPFCHQTMLCKKAVLNKYNGFNEAYKFAADYELIAKILYNKHKYSIVDDIVIGYRAGGTSSTNAKLTKDEIIEAVYTIVFSSVLTKNEVCSLFCTCFPITPVLKILLTPKLSLQVKISFLSNIKVIFKRIIKFRFLIVPIERYIRNKKQLR